MDFFVQACGYFNNEGNIKSDVSTLEIPISGLNKADLLKKRSNTIG